MAEKLTDPNKAAHEIIQVLEDGDAIRNDGVRLTAANKNPWYVLATIYGEQPDRAFGWKHDKKLAAKNRRAWNGWFCGGLSEADRKDRAQKTGLKPDDLKPLSKDELDEIKKRFAARMGKSAKLPLKDKDIDFSKVFFSKYVSFNKFVFENYADFRFTTFRGDADFRSASFRGAAGFRSTTFSEGADFRSASFSRDADFSSASFSVAHFHSTTFSGVANFSSTTFSGAADFSSASFSVAHFRSTTFSVAHFRFTMFRGAVDFSSALFSAADFSSASFSGDADFRSASFSVAHFSTTTFSGAADFRSTTFSGAADFHSTTFNGFAAFSSTTFSGVAHFHSTTFSGFAGFSFTTFSDDADFSSPTFSDVANFSSAKFHSTTRFTEARFSTHVPQFHAAELYDDTVFPIPDKFTDNWPPVTGKVKIEGQEDPVVVMAAAEQKRAYNRLRLFMNRSLQIDEEQFFHRQEMRCKMALADWWHKPFYWLYAWLSDYGNSVWRPMAWMIAVMLSGALFMLWWQGAFTFLPKESTGFDWTMGLLGEDDPWVKLREAAGWSISNTLPFLGFGKLYYGELAKDLAWPLKVVGGVQTLLGYVLLFFLGLGLRNRFRLR